MGMDQKFYLHILLSMVFQLALHGRKCPHGEFDERSLRKIMIISYSRNFKFLTHSEHSLWQYTSLAITVIPLIVAPIDFFLATRLRIHGIESCGKLEQTALLTLDLVM